MIKINNFVIVFIIILKLNISSGSQNKTQNLTKTLSELHTNLRFGKHNIDIFRQISGRIEYSEENCDEQLEYWLIALNESQEWSIKMLDSWGKIPSGILTGNAFHLGSFDECLDVNAATEFGLIEGQYCLQPISLIQQESKSQSRVTLLGGNPLSVNLGFGIGSCFPKSCSPEYFQTILNDLLQPFNITTMQMDPDLLCFTNDKDEMDTIDIIVTVLLSLILFLMICCTIYDLYTSHHNLQQKQICMAFSVYSNGVKLFSCKQSKSPDVMNCLNGIRVLSIVWIIYGHVYSLTIYGIMVNPIAIEKWLKHYHAMVILSGPLAVDTFFVLSGLLVTWNVFKQLEKCNGKLNIPLMYFHRYLRLTPPYIALILFGLSYFKYLGLGPLSKFVQKFMISDNCEDYWWSGLLYIQNYYNPDNICLQHTWYLSVDMQLFILSPILLIPLWKWGRHMMPLIATLIFLSVGCTFAIFYVNNFSASFIKGGGISDNVQMKKIYFATHARMGTWLIGVILAYNIFKIRNKKLLLSKYAIITGWIAAIGIILVIVFGQYEMQQQGYEEDKLESSMYTALYRIGWSIALAWIIFACVTGHGGYVNSFLSMSIWLPLARLSYAMYLLHLMLQTMRIKSLKVGLYFSEWNIVQTFWGDFGTTITLSIFWVLAFESPILIIEKLLFNKQKKQLTNVSQSTVPHTLVNSSELV